MKTRLEKWVWESGQKIGPATGLMCIHRKVEENSDIKVNATTWLYHEKCLDSISNFGR